MPFAWTYHPPRENWNQRHLGADDAAGLSAEVVETSGGGPWMVTVRRGKEIVGVHRMAADAEAGKRMADEAGPAGAAR